MNARNYPIRKNKLSWIITRLISVIALSVIILWANQKFLTSHQMVNTCPLLGICFIILIAIAVTTFIIEPALIRLIRLIKGIKVITDGSWTEITGRGYVIEQDEEESYECVRVQVGDKWKIVQLVHRMKKSDRPDYLKDNDDDDDI